MLWGSRNEAAAGTSRWRYIHQQSRWWDWVEEMSDPDTSTGDHDVKSVAPDTGTVPG
jgi:hypothetical protein